MKKNLLQLIIIILPYTISAQKDTEFWFAAPEITAGTNGINYDQPVRFVFSTYEAPATITLSQPSNPSFQTRIQYVAANSTTTFDFPPDFQTVENIPANQVNNIGFLIQSTAPISGYYEALGGTNLSNPEIFSLKGKNAKGLLFYIPFQTRIDNSNAYSPTPSSEFDIVATENNTVVTITPTKNLLGRPAGVSFNITLQKGQTWVGRSNTLSGSNHPSGTKIVSTKPICVTMKDDLLEGGLVYGGSCRDIMGDQIIPVEKMGKKHIVQKGLLSGVEFAFVVATANNTNIYRGGSLAGTINEGQTLEILVNESRVFIESDKPVCVLHLSGTGCELAGEVIPSFECSGSESVRFIRPTAEPFRMFLTTKTGDQNGFIVNGNSFTINPNSFEVVPGSNGEFVSAFIELNTFEVPENTSSIIQNTTGLFQMGFLNGLDFGTGCRYGFFSDFGNTIILYDTIRLCANDTVLYRNLPIFANSTFFDTVTTNEGCDTIFQILGLQNPFTIENKSISVCIDEGFIYDGTLYTPPFTLRDTLLSNIFCDTILTITGTVAQPPIIEQLYSICPGDTIQINNQLVTNAIQFMDTISVVGNCDTIINVSVVNAETPKPFLPIDTILCTGERILITSPYKNTIWNGSLRATEYTITNCDPVHVDVINEFGCKFSQLMKVRPCCDINGMYVPNAFSPQSDSPYNTFKPYLITSRCTAYHLQIYDRWGELVYTGTQSDNGWDGTFRGKNAPSGVYVWVMNISTGKGFDKNILSGDVTLIR
jgi:gliding motility-associated-like protein